MFAKSLPPCQSPLRRYVCSGSQTPQIHTLPAELLLEIFFWCHPLGLHVTTGEKPIAEAMSLAQTCSRWRQICLGSTTLWNQINVNLVDVGRNATQLVELYLRYSRDAPLILTITDFEEGEDDIHAEELEDAAYDILASLVAACERWSRVNLDVAWNFFDAFPFDMPDLQVPEPFPRLESLSVQWEPVSSVTDFCKSNVLFDKLAFAQNLRDLEIASYNTTIPMPLQKLTRISVCSLTCWTFYQLLSSCQSLEYLMVDHLVLSEDDFFVVSCSPSLKNARLSVGGNSHHIEQLFQSITLPSLNDLHIQASCTEFPLDSVTSMLCRSKSINGLQQLSLDAAAKDTELLDLLRLTKNLRALRIHTHYQLTSHFFSQLTFPTDTRSFREVLIPNLNYLYLACHCFAAPIGIAGIEMFESRFQPASWLPQSYRSLTLHLPRRNRQLPASMLTRLGYLTSIGLDLRII
ncbi:hypothetical protein D9757_006107 [Collybiopsis confluens]|uniref:F-box domain-containing protein n=1 Tax=Collybiopsis confluens TaxID=2823264 RepID=A0A8H5M7C5_9AGAR|nr:hypothetical protein D9757_006107 [Collybiopsis confluens]